MADLLRFFETPGFTREWHKQGLGDDELRELQSAIADRPEAYPLLVGTGGLRKIRFAGRSGRGKSGGHRVCYAYISRHGAVLLVTVFTKDEKANLSAEDKKAATSVIARFEEDLEEGRL